MDAEERTTNELKDLRRDLAEAHAQAKSTHHALTALATTLKEVVERQDKYERGLKVDSFVAYLLFTVLLGGGFYALYRSRTEHLGEAQEAAERARLEAVKETETARKELAAREEGARQARELLALARAGKRAELLARAPEITLARVSPVEKEILDEAIARARTDTVDASFAAGLDAVKQQQWKKAVLDLRRALGFESDTPRAAQARAQLGLALLKQGDAEEAAKELDAAITAGAERGAPELRYHLANALELARQPERARAEYERFADTRPMHPWAMLARRKAAILARVKQAGAQ